MKKKLFFLILFCCNFSFSQEVVLTEIYGDLDRDDINEKVVVKELKDTTDDGKQRELIVYKKVQDNWKVMVSSKKAILGSESGGMMGDAFSSKEISIEKGILIIGHDGGSSWKWNTIHKYRFQNQNLELIGYETSFGKICEYWEEFDYNLSTGKIIYTKTTEICDDDGINKDSREVQETFHKKPQKIPNIETINTFESKIITPKYKAELRF